MQLISLAISGLAMAATLVSALPAEGSGPSCRSTGGGTSYPVKADGLHCRSGPGTGYASKKTYSKGQKVKISCQTTGTNIFGNNIWDKTSDGCYVADHYIKTGIDGYVTKKCPPSSGGGSSGGGSSGGGSGDKKIPGPVKNDYPYSGKCSGVDKWNYYKCQCTSFVAWRINERLGVKFHNQYKGTNWGNANTWDEAAKKTGVKINNTPVPGAIAQTNAGNYGHVAWVTKVSGNQVTIEEYNYVKKEGYSTRTVPKSSFNYIHVKV
jgi:surface antigen